MRVDSKESLMFKEYVGLRKRCVLCNVTIVVSLAYGWGDEKTKCKSYE